MEGQAGFIDYSIESGANSGDRARGLEVFDYDDDGDLDMIVANTQDKINLFRNELIGEGGQIAGKNWIKIWLEGTVSNRSAFGTEVKITIDGISYYRWHHGAGFLGQSIKPVHFGLSDANVIDEIQVVWLSGLIQTFENVGVNRTITITEGSVTVPTKEEVLKAYPFKISEPFPNPFKISTSLRFEVQEAGTTQLRVYSGSGNEVYKTTHKSVGPDSFIINWPGQDLQEQFPSGIYFYSAEFNGFRIVGRLIKTGAD